MVLIKTLQGCLMFLGIIALIFFIVIAAELILILGIYAAKTPGPDALREQEDYDKIKQKSAGGQSQEESESG